MLPALTITQPHWLNPLSTGGEQPTQGCPLRMRTAKERTQHPRPMHVSTIICTRNRSDLIGPALTSVLANTYASFDVLVVDQSDDDRTREVVTSLAAKHANLRYLHTPIAGLSRAYNIGIRESRGEVLAFTDDDCIAPPDWIASIV